MKKLLPSTIITILFSLIINCFTNVSAIGLDGNPRFTYLDMHQGIRTYLDKSSLVLLQNDGKAVVFAYTTTNAKMDGTITRYSKPITMKHNWSDPLNIVYYKNDNGLWTRQDMDITAHYMWTTKAAFCSGYELLLGKKYPYTPKYTR